MKKLIIIAIAVFFAGLATCRAADFVSPVSARLDSKERKPLTLQSRWQKKHPGPHHHPERHELFCLRPFKSNNYCYPI